MQMHWFWLLVMVTFLLIGVAGFVLMAVAGRKGKHPSGRSWLFVFVGIVGGLAAMGSQMLYERHVASNLRDELVSLLQKDCGHRIWHNDEIVDAGLYKEELLKIRKARYGQRFIQELGPEQRILIACGEESKELILKRDRQKRRGFRVHLLGDPLWHRKAFGRVNSELIEDRY